LCTIFNVVSTQHHVFAPLQQRGHRRLSFKVRSACREFRKRRGIGGSHMTRPLTVGQFDRPRRSKSNRVNGVVADVATCSRAACTICVSWINQPWTCQCRDACCRLEEPTDQQDFKRAIRAGPVESLWYVGNVTLRRSKNISKEYEHCVWRALRSILCGALIDLTRWSGESRSVETRPGFDRVARRDCLIGVIGLCRVPVAHADL